jgi:hypothetical protein
MECQWPLDVSRYCKRGGEVNALGIYLVKMQQANYTFNLKVAK